MNTVMDCPSGRDCNVDCYIADRRRLITDFNNHQNSRSLQAVYVCSHEDNVGCCGATINCPAGYACTIDCDRGCNGLTVNAQQAASLSIFGCDTRGGDYECGNMEVYCPINGRGGTTTCSITGITSNEGMENVNIYTEEGFNLYPTSVVQKRQITTRSTTLVG